MPMEKKSCSAMDRTRCLSKAFLAVNVISFLIGVVAVGCGVWVLVFEHDDLMNYLNKLTSDIGTLLTIAVCQLFVFGVVAIVVAVIGFYIPAKHSKRHHHIYFGLKMLELVTAWSIICTMTFTLAFYTDLKTHMQQLVQNTYNSHVSVHGAGDVYEYSWANDETLAADIVQLKFGCCGVINGFDYSNATKWNRKPSGSNSTMIIPATCCQINGAAELSSLLKQGASRNVTLNNSTCPFTSYDSNVNTGCYNAVRDTLRTILGLINVLGVFVGPVQTVGSIIFPLLYKSEFKYKVMPDASLSPYELSTVAAGNRVA